MTPDAAARLEARILDYVRLEPGEWTAAALVEDLAGQERPQHVLDAVARMIAAGRLVGDVHLWLPEQAEQPVPTATPAAPAKPARGPRPKRPAPPEGWTSSCRHEGASTARPLVLDTIRNAVAPISTQMVQAVLGLPMNQVLGAVLALAAAGSIVRAPAPAHIGGRSGKRAPRFWVVAPTPTIKGCPVVRWLHRTGALASAQTIARALAMPIAEVRAALQVAYENHQVASREKSYWYWTSALRERARTRRGPRTADTRSTP